jgi:hypothetical protein
MKANAGRDDARHLGLRGRPRTGLTINFAAAPARRKSSIADGPNEVQVALVPAALMTHRKHPKTLRFQ